MTDNSEAKVYSFVRPVVREMAGYVPGEQPQDRRYIKLNTNENPYPPSPRVIAAVQASATEELRLYPDPMANALRDKAAAVYGFTRENILAGNGSDDLLAMIIRTCVGPGDKVAYATPTYSLYDTLVAIGGGQPVHVPYEPDFALPKALAAVESKVTFVCQPNSPSATATSAGAIEELAQRVSGLLVVDEAYVDFGDETVLPLVHRFDNLVVLRTFSKSFSLAGMRIGLAFSSPGVIGELAKVKDSYNLTRASIVAAVAALEDYAWMRSNVAKVRSTRSRLIVALRRLQFDVPESQTNFVLARRTGVDQRPTYEALKARGILVRYFATPDLYDALRITVGTDEEIDALLAELERI